MKLKFFFSFFLVLTLFSNSYAQNFGAPEPLARDGNISIGLGYAYYANEYKDRSSSNTFEVKQNLIFAPN